MLDTGTIPETNENIKSMIIAASISGARNLLQSTFIFQETRANLKLIMLDGHYDLLDAFAHMAFNLKKPLHILSPPPVSIAL